MANPNIFISYRRSDSIGHAGRIFDRFVEHFGSEHVFRDVDTIPIGEDFVEAIRAKIKKTDVLLALIGPRWLTATDEEGRWRLANENDWVRVEIVTALDLNIRVIPVLLEGCKMPQVKDLPGDLARLAYRKASAIRDDNFDVDVAQLIREIKPSCRQKLLRLLSHKAAKIILFLLLTGLLSYWIYPQLILTPAKARIQLVQMGMQFDANTFIERAANNDLQAVSLFLRAGIEPDIEDNEERSALKVAAAKGHMQIVKTLIEAGAKPTKALSWAAGRGQKQVFEYLLTCNPDQIGLDESLYAAVGQHYLDIVKLLLDRNASPNFVDKEKGKTVLMAAIDSRTPSMDEIGLLIAKGANVNDKPGNKWPSALFVAVGKFNPDVVDVLLEQGADVNVRDDDGSTPLYRALTESSTGEIGGEEGRLKIVQSLLAKGAEVNRSTGGAVAWKSPLFGAIANDKQELALLLIEHGANVNETSSTDSNTAGVTVLMKAAEHGMVEVIKALLVKGVDVNARDEDGATALLSASNDDVIQLLLANGADPTLTDNQGQTVFMRAAFHESVLSDETFSRLLKHGAKLNAVYASGWTALMYATDTNNGYPDEKIDFVRQLLKFGANKLLKNDEGETALAIARKQESTKIAYLLSKSN